jgi:hypothetical protein
MDLVIFWGIFFPLTHLVTLLLPKIAFQTPNAMQKSVVSFYFVKKVLYV